MQVPAPLGSRRGWPLLRRFPLDTTAGSVVPCPSIVAPRDPSRPKAAHIPDVEMLECLDAHAHLPADWFDTFPIKVVREKLQKLFDRGLVTFDHAKGLLGGARLTLQGQEHLVRLQVERAKAQAPRVEASA